MAGKARSTRITGQARQVMTQDVVARYQGGHSIRQLAQSTGRSYGFIHRLLTESGVQLRGRGGATRSRPPVTGAD
jgi:transposase